ncbi:MAG: LysR family transcriptional regulator [Bradyrhizobium sp.]|uniref:LysR family transcriptional regulator n=1 Tax=Bradyrhizobium sp. TaxID=376 RepID=UPI0025BC74AF|nr:LysR family transcriptional regulator [Bradyrhizobium sp.]MBI5263334.1 LysR family transcriptional regulator [Bradyrhizobium sp.]
MTLEQLRIFIAVAERQHITQAAAALNRTQSAVSAAISSLENRHGIRLFDRLGRRIALTAAGKTFLEEAKELLARSRATEQVLADLAELKIGSLSLAASQTVGNYWLPPRLHRFIQSYPGVSLQLMIGNTQEVAALVAAGEVDLGFVEGEVRDASLTTRAVDEDHLVIVAAPNIKIPRKPDAAWLTTVPWVAREAGSGTREAFEAALRKFGVRLSERRIALELPSNESVRAAVEAGAGLAIMSQLVADSSIRSGTLVALPLELAKRRFYSIKHKERYLSLAARSLLKIPGAESPS